MHKRVSQVLLLTALAWGGLATVPAHAGVFDDDEARRAIIDMRDKFNGFQATAAQRIDQNTRVQQDLQTQLEQLKTEVARLRGQNEVLQNQVETLQKQQKDYYTDLNERLSRFEPKKATIDGREGLVQPGEQAEYDIAMKQFRDRDFRGAGSSFSAFIKKYPQSPSVPLAQYWLGNALYAQKDYRGSTVVLQNMVQTYPDHPKAGDALVAIATNQAESGQKVAARKTLEQVISQYAGSPAAQAASGQLKTLR
jgi:tol-pal system protein YbgF